MHTPSVLLTVVPRVDYPGSIPTEPVSRCVATLLVGGGFWVSIQPNLPSPCAGHWRTLVVGAPHKHAARFGTAPRSMFFGND